MRYHGTIAADRINELDVPDILESDSIPESQEVEAADTDLSGETYGS